MRTYKAEYSSKIGAWMVLNLETKIYHSRWDSSREASMAAADLNRAVAKMNFSKGMVKLMNAPVTKPKPVAPVLSIVPKQGA